MPRGPILDPQETDGTSDILQFKHTRTKVQTGDAAMTLQALRVGRTHLLTILDAILSYWRLPCTTKYLDWYTCKTVGVLHRHQNILQWPNDNKYNSHHICGRTVDNVCLRTYRAFQAHGLSFTLALLTRLCQSKL